MGYTGTRFPERTQLALADGSLDRIAVVAELEGLNKGQYMRRAIMVHVAESERRFSVAKKEAK